MERTNKQRSASESPPECLPGEPAADLPFHRTLCGPVANAVLAEEVRQGGRRLTQFAARRIAGESQRNHRRTAG